MAIPRTRQWLARHPLADGKFFFFIFALIPVQTLFVYNWMVLPQYINRAFEGWIGEYFEIAANSNPILIFIAVPIIAAMTRTKPVYNMMIIGTFIMAAPAFLLVIGPHWWTLFPYILIMTIGEAMWQPRFLQYAAEIAPEGRTGESWPRVMPAISNRRPSQSPVAMFTSTPLPNPGKIPSASRPESVG